MRVLNNDNLVTEVEYINKVLKSKKRGLNKIAAEDYNSTDKDLLNELKALGYIRVKNQFTLENDVVQGVVQEEVQEVVQGVVQDTKSEETSDFKCADNSNSTDIVNINSYLKDNSSYLVEIIEQYKKANVVQRGDIVVQLPFEEDKSYKISMRVNKTVMDQFKEFCNDNKNFSQKELLSMAMVEYMNNHQ